MPHVFFPEKGKFEQVHIKKVPQQAAKDTKKRARNAEYCKFLLGFEPVPEKLAARLEKEAEEKESKGRMKKML